MYIELKNLLVVATCCRAFQTVAIYFITWCLLVSPAVISSFASLGGVFFCVNSIVCTFVYPPLSRKSNVCKVFLKYSTLPVQPHVADKTSKFAELFCLLNLLRSSAVVTTPSPSPPPPLWLVLNQPIFGHPSICPIVKRLKNSTKLVCSL